MKKLITKSFSRLLDRGIHRGFITYDELQRSLGKRNSSLDNFEQTFIHIADNKICLVEKKSDFKNLRKKEASKSDVAVKALVALYN